MEIRNKKWDDDEFQEARREVLAMWPTGKEIDLDEAIHYQLQKRWRRRKRMGNR
jgi:methylaspartate mutase epsilon subunit